MRSDTFWQYFDSVKERFPNRANTFRMMFEHLDSFDRPVTIVETGCIEDPDNWAGNGCSSILFDKYVEAHSGSRAYSAEIVQSKVTMAAKLCPHVHFLCGDSIFAIKQLEAGQLNTRQIDLLYLDASHLDWTNIAPAAAHHLAELQAAMPMIRDNTLVVVDDAPLVADDYPFPSVGGKGAYVADYAIGVGADMIFHEYQAGWTGMNRANVKEDASLEVTVWRARHAIEATNIPAAGKLYRQIIICTNPPKTSVARVSRGEACAFFAQIALRNNRLGTAADWYRRAMDADHLCADYRVELALKCFLPIGHLRAALGEAERAVAMEPTNMQAWKVLGGCYHELANAEGAQEAYGRALEVEPGNPDALLDLATLLLDTADYDGVGRCCHAVLEMGGERVADAMHCLAMVAYREHRHEDAILLYDDAIEMGCRDKPTAHWNKSLALHSIGRYREGWVEHEWREFSKQNPALYLPMKRFTLPRWKGEPAWQFPPNSQSANKGEGPCLIHVHYEAGAGDNLSCARYLTELVKRGFRVRYETAPDMVDLMRHSFPGVEIVPKAPDYPGSVGLEPFDYHCPIGSLPAVFETDIDTVPWQGPYLRPDLAKVEQYRAKVAEWVTPNGLKVGLCWSSGIRQGLWIKEYGLRKSMPFMTMRPIFSFTSRLAGDACFSLQVGPERLQRQNPVVDLLPAKPTWHDTAALIACLDVVVTVDTGVAHLAGAMGKTVFLLCQRDGQSWHFMCWRNGASWNEASPWYPSMRVFRPQSYLPHYWDDAVYEVATALESLAVAQAAE